MNQSIAEILREYGPFSGIPRVPESPMTGRTSGLLLETRLTPSTCEREDAALDQSPPMQARPSTANTSISSPGIASRKSIRRPAVCSRRSRRPRRQQFRAHMGRRDTLGRAVSETGRSIKWIPKPARFFAPSSPPLRHRRYLDRGRALARHLGHAGGCEADHSRWRRSGRARHAARRESPRLESRPISCLRKVAAGGAVAWQGAGSWATTPILEVILRASKRSGRHGTS